MKSFREQSYYELLELAPGASEEQVRAAYRQLSEQFSDDAVALYGLADPGEAEALRARLAEAVACLTDALSRAEYDRSIGLPPRLLPPPLEEPSSPKQLAMTELLTKVEAMHSTHPQYQVSYIPHPPQEQRASEWLREAAAPEAPATASAGADDADEGAATGLTAALAHADRAAESQPEAPLTPAPVPEPAQGPPPGPPRREVAPEMAQEAAIASAEAALAQVAAKVREGRPPPFTEPRPKAMDIPADAEFNGELLRQVRQSRGLSLEQLAERTRITSRHLGNVEADRYDALPVTVYLRGILMNIARELGLDPLRVSKSYLGLVGSARKQ